MKKERSTPSAKHAFLPCRNKQADVQTAEELECVRGIKSPAFQKARSACFINVTALLLPSFSTDFFKSFKTTKHHLKQVLTPICKREAFSRDPSISACSPLTSIWNPVTWEIPRSARRFCCTLPGIQWLPWGKGNAVFSHKISVLLQPEVRFLIKLTTGLDCFVGFFQWDPGSSTILILTFTVYTHTHTPWNCRA